LACRIFGKSKGEVWSADVRLVAGTVVWNCPPFFPGIRLAAGRYVPLEEKPADSGCLSAACPAFRRPAAILTIPSHETSNQKADSIADRLSGH